MQNSAQRHFEFILKYIDFDFDEIGREDFSKLQKDTLLMGQGINKGFPAPILILNAYKTIHNYQKVFIEENNLLVLMWANKIVLEYKLIAPNWLAEELIKRTVDVQDYNHRSWDFVVGSPIPKGKSIKKLKEENDLWLEMACEFFERKYKGQGFSTDLMDEIGEIYEINREKVWEMYKKMRDLGYFDSF